MQLLRMTRDFGAAPPPDWRVSDALVDNAGSVHAWVSALNPLRDVIPARGWGRGAMVLFSGGAHAGDDEERPAWMPQSRERFTLAAKALDALGGDIWVWPRFDHALSDIPGVQTFLRAHERFGLLFDPIAMLAPSMLAQAEDHLARMFQVFGPHPQTRAVMLTNIAPGSEIEGVRVAPVHRGVIRPKLIIELWREHCRAETPVVLIDEEVTEQRNALA